MKGIYLAAFKAHHPKYDIVYQDINGKRDIGGDMMDVDLTQFDFIIATPPCNYYSRANYRREVSVYSQKTKQLLPSILEKLCKQDKPFIVENVKNKRLYSLLGLYNFPCFVYFIGRHTYWTNVLLPSGIIQSNDFRYGGYQVKNMYNLTRSDRQGGHNVHEVVELFLEIIHACVK